jgi:hypothetical protein
MLSDSSKSPSLPSIMEPPRFGPPRLQAKSLLDALYHQQRFNRHLLVSRPRFEQRFKWPTANGPGSGASQQPWREDVDIYLCRSSQSTFVRIHFMGSPAWLIIPCRRPARPDSRNKRETDVLNESGTRVTDLDPSPVRWNPAGSAGLRIFQLLETACSFPFSTVPQPAVIGSSTSSFRILASHHPRNFFSRRFLLHCGEPPYERHT